MTEEKVKTLSDGGRVYIPDDIERKTLEGLVEKGLVEYGDGGYYLTKKGIKICKKKFS